MRERARAHEGKRGKIICPSIEISFSSPSVLFLAVSCLGTGGNQIVTGIQESEGRRWAKLGKWPLSRNYRGTGGLNTENALKIRIKKRANAGRIDGYNRETIVSRSPFKCTRNNTAGGKPAQGRKHNYETREAVYDSRGRRVNCVRESFIALMTFNR